MAEIEGMEDLEDGEIEDSGSEDNSNVPRQQIAQPPAKFQTRPPRMKVPGLSSDEDEGNSSDEDIPQKRQFMQTVKNHRDEDFSNPLRAAKDSGFQYDKNYWLDGAYQSTNRSSLGVGLGPGGGGAATKPKKRINNIWGSVLEEDILTTEIKGLQNDEAVEDDRGMGVESYDWRKSKDDTRPYVEREESLSEGENKEEVIPDLEGKESFGTLKTKPRRVKDRLGKREDSIESENESETETEERQSVKDRLGERPDSESSDDGGKRGSVRSRLGGYDKSIHRNSPVDPDMEGVAQKNADLLEHRKLHDKIREHQSGAGGREHCGGKAGREEGIEEGERKQRIRMNRKRGAEAKSINQRDKAIQYVPMKKVDVSADMEAEILVERFVEGLGEPEDKKITFSRLIRLCGADKVLKLFRATEDVEDMGGLCIQNGTRRRTPGGVFFFLLKNDKDVTPEIMDEVFQEQREEWKAQCKERKKERKRRAKDQKKRVYGEHEQNDSFAGELERYKKLKDVKQSGDEKKENDKDGMEQEVESKQEMDCLPPVPHGRKLENVEEDDLFDAYAEEIELDVA